MGVQEPVEDTFADVPATPPGDQDLGSDDDIFTHIDDGRKPPVTTQKNDLFKGIIPALPYKGKFDFLGVHNEKDVWGLQSYIIKKKKKQCPTCTEDAKRDLKRLEQFLQKCKNEADDLRAENQSLKNELEELKKLMKNNYNDSNFGVNVSVAKNIEGAFELFMGKNIYENCINQENNTCENKTSKKHLPSLTNNYGVKSFSISFPKENINSSKIKEDFNNSETKGRKSVAQLRKEFFEKEFQSERKIFTSRNYLEIKPEEKKDTFKSQLTIRVKPKTRIAEVISKLNLLNTTSRVIPEAVPVSMFQRFEKSRIVWQNDFSERPVLKRNPITCD